jgi:ribosomal protein L28
LILALFVLATATYFAPEKSDQVKLTSTYPATVCPAIGNKVSSIAALTNSKVNRRLVDGRSKILKPGKSSVIALSKDAVLVEGNAGTAITFANNGWKSVVPCSVSNGTQWFVGGSGALTSKSYLYIVNSGFSQSLVDLEVFTPNGALEPKSVSIPQNSTKKLSVDSLVPGEDVIVIGVKTQSGRVSSYLFDERKKGLRSLGADFIAPIGSSSKKVTISAISGLTGKLVTQSNSVSHAMRVLVPGKIDANVSVTINSNDGNFVPVGLAELKVKSQRVLNFNYGKSSEIAWATAADDLAKWSVNLTGSRPTLTFSGKKINVSISATGINGKKITKTITGANFATWRPPVGLNRLQISANKKGISGGVIFLPDAGGIGSSYIPMNNGANLETASEPIADASVITRG